MSLEARKQRWISFMDLASPTKTICLIDFDDHEALGERPWPYPGRTQARIDWALRQYERALQRTQWLHDDAVPGVHPYTGTEIFAQAFGSPVHLPGDNMPFARPAIYDRSGLSALRPPSIDGAVLGELFELARALRERAGKDALMTLPDIQSPLDIAALIWEKADFLVAMIDEADAVLALCDMTERTLTEFLDRWFAEFGTDYMAHYPDYFMRGGLTLSEDEIGEFSAPMFEQFCLGALNRLSRRYGGIGIHCCANSRHQWEGLKQVEGLRLINLVQPPKLIKEAYSVFADTAAQMHSWFGDGEPSDAWLDGFPPRAHVVLRDRATDRDDALRKLDRLRALADQRESGCIPPSAN